MCIAVFNQLHRSRPVRMYKTKKTGKGILNTLINRLPFEAHVPGYQFCGPGTNLKKRLARGDKGINLLDAACRDHDITYSNSSELSKRHEADNILENRAWERVKAADSSKKEKAIAYMVTNAMKAKRKMGMGCNVKCKQKKKRNVKRKNNSSGKNNRRIILNPNKIGGVLPLIPIFAGLSALGSLASGGSAVYNAYNTYKRNKGNGYYLDPPTGKGMKKKKKRKL